MQQITFLTGNSYKFQVAQKVLEGSGVELVQKKIETPEIQSIDVKEIASYSSKWAANELNTPVSLTDAGYYIEALNGFPGPYIKFINQWLTSDDLLRLLDGITNRKVKVIGCLAYCEPNKEPVIFTSEVYGRLATKSVKTDKEGTTSINEIFIPEGYDKVETEIPHEEMLIFWAKVENYWNDLADYLQNGKA